MCKQGTEKKITLTDGQTKSCDECIQQIVQALNDAGLQTTSSCCGHNKQPLNIILKDGREIFVVNTWKEGRRINALYPPLHWWSRGKWRYCLKMKLAKLLLNPKT